MGGWAQQELRSPGGEANIEPQKVKTVTTTLLTIVSISNFMK